MDKIVNNEKYEQQVLKLLNETRAPVSIDFVRFNLKIHWVTARALLMEMALEGKLQAQKTTKSWVFFLAPSQEEAPR